MGHFSNDNSFEGNFRIGRFCHGDERCYLHLMEVLIFVTQPCSLIRASAKSSFLLLSHKSRCPFLSIKTSSFDFAACQWSLVELFSDFEAAFLIEIKFVFSKSNLDSKERL